MSSRIEQLIDEIEEYIDGCKYQTFSDTKIIVNKEEIVLVSRKKCYSQRFQTKHSL